MADSTLSHLRNNIVSQRHNGAEFGRIARRLGISENTAREIYNDARRNRSRRAVLSGHNATMAVCAMLRRLRGLAEVANG